MRRNQRGFTLMELLVVIVIVAILAAVAVPLYTNYVRDAYRTEARGAISAVITAEQAFYQRHGGVQYEGNLQTLVDDGYINPQDWSANWNITIVAADANGFTIQAIGTGRDGGPPANIGVQYIYSRAGGGNWNDINPQTP